MIRDPYSTNRPGLVSIIPDVSPTPIRPPLAPLSQLQEVPGARDSRSLPIGNRLGSRSVSQDSVYTILIRLPPDGGSGDERAPSIKMIQEDTKSQKNIGPGGGNYQKSDKFCGKQLPSRDSEYSLPLGRRMSHAPDIRIPLNAKIIPKPLTKPHPVPRQAKKKKKSQEKRQETKAAKTLSAILLSFIITWTPYNILVLLKPLTACTKCIPQELWDFFYALCYINSTINPMCYALCNASFRRTYVRILTCKWHTRNREAMTRGVYN